MYKCIAVCVCLTRGVQNKRMNIRSGGHCYLLVSCSVVPTERGSELCPFRRLQHWPADGEHRSNTGEASKCACVFAWFNLWRNELTSYVKLGFFCLSVHNSSLFSWVQLGLSGSLLLHAWVLYCTVLIRSAEYLLLGGISAGVTAASSSDKMHRFNVCRWVGVFMCSPHVKSGLQ